MIKRVIIPGLIIGIVMLLMGMALSRAYTMAFPQLESQYEDSYLFRPWSDPLMSLFFVHPILVGLVLAWIWDKVKGLFPATQSGWEKALRFALIYAVFSACGMLITYSTFPVSLLMMSSWTLSVFVEGVIGSWILSKLNA